MKTCTKCCETKPTSDFYKHSRQSDGLNSNCKVCVKVTNARWVSENTDRARAAKAKWAGDNPERMRAATAKWASENQEKIQSANSSYYRKNRLRERARRVKYYAENVEKEKAATRTWQLANPGAKQSYDHNRRARLNGGKLSKDIAQRLHKLQRGMCPCCCQPLGANFHRDHVMPLALGGSNTDDNIQLLCATCNHSKGAKHPVEFMQSRGYLL